MGRTNPTFRNVLEAVKTRWGDYRRALRARDRPHLDRLFAHADAHADAAGYLNPDDPMDAVLVSMLLEHERRLAALDARLEALEDGRAEPTPGDGPGDDADELDAVQAIDGSDDADCATDDADDPAQTSDDTTDTGDAPDRRSR